MLKRAILGLLGLTLVLPFAACDDDPLPTGNLVVEYRIGSGSKTCDDVGIDQVRVYVVNSLDDLSSPEARGFTNCDPEDQTVEIEGIDQGDYFIRVEGLDEDGNLIYEGQTNDRERIQGNEDNTVSIRLIEILPSLEIWFDFPEAGPCSRFEVETIVVVVYEDGSTPIFDNSGDPPACEDQINESLEIPDLDTSATYDIRIRGVNADGDYVYEYNVDDIELGPGEEREISAVFEACDPECEAP